MMNTMPDPAAGHANGERLAPLSKAVVLLAIAKTIFHFATYQGYGIFRDELYFLACARHLDWGFVDQLPFASFMLAVVTGVLGESLFAIRFLPSLLGGVPVLLGAVAAREFGGRSFAQLLAGIAMAVGPFWLGVHHDFNILMFEPIFWTAGALVVVRLIKTENPRLWIWFGGVAGLAMLNKTSVAVFAFGLIAGLLLTRQRKLLLSSWLVAGGALAALITLPALLWQWQRDWPLVEFVRNATQFKNIALSPVDFFLEQVLMLGPPAAAIWMAGIAFLLIGLRGRYRVLGIAWFVMFAVFVVMRGKAYYMVAAYPVFLGAGGVLWESLLEAPRWRWVRVTFAAVVASAIVLAPYAVPVLSQEAYIEFSQRVGLERSSGENHEVGVLPQHYADMHGWSEMVAEVARVYETLFPEQKAMARIFGRNYGEAGAIDYFGPQYGLPAALSGHNTYWIWGPGDWTGEVLIVIGGERPDQYFAQVEAAGRIYHDYAMPYENNLTIWVCLQPKATVAEIWLSVKNYN